MKHFHNWEYKRLNDILKYEKEKVKEKVLWMEKGNPLVIDKNYIPWYIKDGKITEYKLPIN